VQWCVVASAVLRSCWLTGGVRGGVRGGERRKPGRRWWWRQQKAKGGGRGGGGATLHAHVHPLLRGERRGSGADFADMKKTPEYSGVFWNLFRTDPLIFRGLL
jgi:hypothetical protein